MLDDKMKNAPLVVIKYGSHLYGTDTPQSDLDLKGIYLPSSRDILLQRVKPVIVSPRSKKSGEKNSAEDIDYELYSPEMFLHSVAKGQSFALEMLFAPESMYMQKPNELWFEIKKVGMQLLTKQAASFVGYCKQQAYKYGQKGSKLSAAQALLAFLASAQEKYGTQSPLEKITEKLGPLLKAHEDIVFSTLTQPNGHEEQYLEICGKKIPLHASIKNARTIVQNVVSKYGDRALKAAHNEGADWKALSHAVRIAYQAIEFLATHQLTFPRPEREHLRAIKAGTVAYAEVTQEIEALLGGVEKAVAESTLPETYDPNIIDDFIASLYLQLINHSESL